MADTKPIADGNARSFGACLAFAVLLHAPFTPFLSALRWGHARSASHAALPALTDIPIDLSESTPPAAPATATAEPKQVQPVKAVDTSPKLASRAPARPAPAPARQATSGTRQRAPTASAGEPKLPNDGFVARVDVEKARAHGLGARIAATLAILYRWQYFFMQSRVDPLGDIERVDFAGMELGRSSDMATIIQHGLDPATLDRDLARLPTLPGPGLEAFSLVDAVGTRRFALRPTPSIIVVGPESALESARRMAVGSMPPLPDAVVVWAGAATPARTLAVLDLPETITTAKATASLEPDHAVIDIELGDGSPELAAEHAVTLARRLSGLRDFDKASLGQSSLSGVVRAFESSEFSATEARIHGRIVATTAELASVLEITASWLVSHLPSPAPPPSVANPTPTSEE